MRCCWILAALLPLAGCGPAPAPKLAVDACDLREAFAECEAMAPVDQLGTCRKRARQEALRLPGGISPECRAKE